MSKHSRIESRTAVLTRGNAEGQYSCPRLNTTVRGHNTGLLSKHPFHDTFINQCVKYNQYKNIQY
jgi:hypothetical protein